MPLHLCTHIGNYSKFLSKYGCKGVSRHYGILSVRHGSCCVTDEDPGGQNDSLKCPSLLSDCLATNPFLKFPSWQPPKRMTPQVSYLLNHLRKLVLFILLQFLEVFHAGHLIVVLDLWFGWFKRTGEDRHSSILDHLKEKGDCIVHKQSYNIEIHWAIYWHKCIHTGMCIISTPVTYIP